MDYALRHAQARYDSLLPEDFEAPEDDSLTEDEAAEIAQAEIDATPCVVAAWINGECMAEDEPVDPNKYADRFEADCPVAVILTAIMTCNRESMGSWAYALRERFAAHCDAQGLLKERTAELLAADQRERQRAADMAAQEYFRVD